MKLVELAAVADTDDDALKYLITVFIMEQILLIKKMVMLLVILYVLTMMYQPPHHASMNILYRYQISGLSFISVIIETV